MVESPFRSFFMGGFECSAHRRGDGMDEATSALDTASEMEIQRALLELMTGRTVIAVAHRLSTVAAFDRVLVMSNGRIVEDGRANELKRDGGPFSRMWRPQFESLPAPVPS